MKKLTFLKNKKIAHLGVYDNKKIYENSLEAIVKALKKDFIISLDIKMLKDGSLVLFSDNTLERLLHVDQKIAKVKRDDLDYISKYKIPTLDEALLVINGRVPVIINIKCSARKHGVENYILNLMKDYPGLFAIQSNNTSQLKYIHKKNKDVIIGHVINKKNYYNFIFFHDFDYVCIDALLVSEKQAKKLKEDYFLVGYGVKTQEQFDKKKNGYDALMCDNILDIK